MCTASIYELRTNLSKYIHKLEEEEEEIIITNNGVIVAKLIPFSSPENGIEFGTAKRYLKNGNKGDPFFGDEEIAKDFEEAL